MTRDQRLIDAKAVSMGELITRLGITDLHRAGAEMVGPCPQCGGTDRFGINLQSNLFICRRCDAGGDQIALVMHVLGLEFRAALDWLVGPEQELTPEQKAAQAKRRREAAEKRRQQEAYASRARANSIREARSIWSAAIEAEGTPVRDYLTRRGITRDLLPELPVTIRYQPDARYMHPAKGRRGEWDLLHSGPAMVAAVTDARGYVTAVHRTWIDLDQPAGKLSLSDPHQPDRQLPSKKVLGSKKGRSIRLLTPKDAAAMIMAEGIENALTAMVARHAGVAMPAACAFWCGVDLGNMGGRMQRVAGTRWSGRPDMNDAEAWIPPPWVRHLIFIQDGDSHPQSTRARLESGLRRAMIRNPGLRAQIVHSGEGRDLNDILMGVSE